jgi:hypothetical protein
VAVTMVYINYHWLTDVVAAVPLGLVLSRVMHRIPWDKIQLPPQRQAEQEVGVERAQPSWSESWTRLPQAVARSAQRPAPLFARLWSGTHPSRLHERQETPGHRRPGPVGPSGRQLRLARARDGGGRSVRLRDEYE